MESMPMIEEKFLNLSKVIAQFVNDQKALFQKDCRLTIITKPVTSEGSFAFTAINIELEDTRGNRLYLFTNI